MITSAPAVLDMLFNLVFGVPISQRVHLAPTAVSVDGRVTAMMMVVVMPTSPSTVALARSSGRSVLESRRRLGLRGSHNRRRFVHTSDRLNHVSTAGQRGIALAISARSLERAAAVLALVASPVPGGRRRRFQRSRGSSLNRGFQDCCLERKGNLS